MLWGRVWVSNNYKEIVRKLFIVSQVPPTQEQGKVIAIKPGHKINTEFAKVLKEKYAEAKRLKGKPKYDPTLPPIKDTEEIKLIIVCRDVKNQLDVN